jgi:hypothetical protein
MLHLSGLPGSFHSRARTSTRRTERFSTSDIGDRHSPTRGLIQQGDPTALSGITPEYPVMIENSLLRQASVDYGGATYEDKFTIGRNRQDTLKSGLVLLPASRVCGFPLSGDVCKRHDHRVPAWFLLLGLRASPRTPSKAPRCAMRTSALGRQDHPGENHVQSRGGWSADVLPFLASQPLAIRSATLVDEVLQHA